MKQAYEVPVAGGTWEHRGLDCKQHGDNVPHAKPYKSAQPFLCVQCMLNYTRRLAAKQLRDQQK